MDFTVEIGEPSLMTESAPSGPAPNQAGEEARAEYSKVMNDPAHPLFEDFKRGGTRSNEYVNALYRKMAERAPVPIKTESLSLGPVEPQEGETPDAAASRARNEVILGPLWAQWGPDYERRFAALQGELRPMFEDRWEALDDLGEYVRSEYGPRGETAALEFFDKLADIRRS
ncbi:MAG TPA: hypothetical protein VK901_18645 [Nitrospiraceae bacterium]|nr:hypothetical protein [Nitrospiraceae bacterium]